MNILITGGKGTIGSPLAEHLRKKGHNVWSCDLMHAGDANYVRCDISKYRQLSGLFEKHSFDHVFHLAAEFGRWNGEDYYENLWMTNVVGTKNMLELQARHRFRMIFASSSEVYGDYERLMSEDIMDRQEIRQMNDYALTKWVNEIQIQNAAESWGNEVVRVRFFNTYGPGEYYSPYRSAICIFIYSAIHDLPYTVYLEHKRNSLYIEDCVEALSRILDTFKPGAVYNIAGSEQHDMKEVSDFILNYLGKDDGRVRYLSKDIFAAKIKIPDISRAKRDLGYHPSVTLREGIPRTIEWMEKVYGGQSE